MKTKTKKASRPLKAHVHLAPDLSHLASNSPNNGFPEIKSIKSGENGVDSTPETIAGAREKPRWKPIAPNGLLNDDLESAICANISKGLTWSDSARLAGCHRSTCWNWKTKGLAYLDDPEAHPEDERYARFVERCEEAELASKVLLVDQISRDPDWRAKAWILKARFPKEFTEFTRQELSGPDGAPVAMNISAQPFQVIFSCPKPDADEKFVTVEHRSPKEIEEPRQPIEPQPTHIGNHKISQPLPHPEDEPEKISKFDPFTSRLYERGLHS